ncbi:MAG: glutamate-5-semialdehyde dehydrogenase [Acidobacteriota bacterium]|nr:glutamate-5-semialdehyde dehydrogenase [Acidobacteriota bacterium]
MKAETVEQKTDVHLLMRKIGERARDAYRVLSVASDTQKNEALIESSKAIRRNIREILDANESDMIAARKSGLSDALIDRLKLDEARVEAMAKGLETVAAFPDPVGKILAQWERPNGLQIERVSVPLGVIGIIYESRPNVTADAGGLCLKSGNAAILRGGSDGFHSSRAIVECLHTGLKAADLPTEIVQIVPTRDRAAVGEMLNLHGLIDIIIPRGGKSLTERILRESRIPTIQHLDGNCHTYIHSSADAQMAEKVLLNAKLRRTGICGATESLLIDEAVSDKLLPDLIKNLLAAGCEIRGDALAQKINSRVIPADEEDWATEYLDAVLSIKTVKNFDEAIRHINFYGSHHTDAIIAEDSATVEAFLSEVDSAIVLHNASTQFADGGEFGMGVEIGISTGRLHARGPVGAEQLTTYKYVVRGSGQTRP